MLEAIKTVNGQKLKLPARPIDHPDRERLSVRFAGFELQK
jgi:hypothetical protein